MAGEDELTRGSVAHCTVELVLGDPRDEAEVTGGNVARQTGRFSDAFCVSKIVATTPLFLLENLYALDPIAASDSVHHIHAFDHLAEHRVSTVEMRLR